VNFVWKCWRDTWSTLAVAMALPCLIVTIFAMDDELYMPATALWPIQVPVTIACLSLGLLLGARMAGRQFGKDVAHFIYTRPQPRAKMLWATWGVCVAELLAATLLTAVFACAAGLLHQHARLSLIADFPYAALLQVITLGVLILSMTFALTVATQREDLGAGMTLVISIAYIVFAAVMTDDYKLNAPMPSQQISSLPMCVSLLLWMAAGAAFVWAAQMVIERREA